MYKNLLKVLSSMFLVCLLIFCSGCSGATALNFMKEMNANLRAISEHERASSDTADNDTEDYVQEGVQEMAQEQDENESAEMGIQQDDVYIKPTLEKESPVYGQKSEAPTSTNSYIQPSSVNTGVKVPRPTLKKSTINRVYTIKPRVEEYRKPKTMIIR